MNRFEDRQKIIIHTIAESDIPLTGKSISAKLKCSVRTIQNEIAKINRYLPLIHSSNKGYRINQDVFMTLHQEIRSQDLSEYEILKTLIFADHPLHIDELADSFYISTSTLEKKLRLFSDILYEFDLHITREKAYISIAGHESDKRRLIRYLILKEADVTYYDFSNLNQYFPDIDTVKMQSVILNTIHTYGYKVDEVYVNTLIINILIALYRMKFEHYIHDEHEYDIQSNMPEYQISCEILNQYESHWTLHPTHKDILYIASLLRGQIKPNHAKEESDHLFLLEPSFVQNIQEILTEAFQYYMLDIDFSQYLYSFALHIDAMMKRSANHQPAHNTALEILKKNSPFIHDVAVFIAQKISETYHVEIVDAEIGFISIHIGYLIENAMHQKHKVHVLLYCDEYQHISENIQKKLLQGLSDIIHLQIIKNLNKENAMLFTADMIITTRPVVYFGKKVVTISPFYNQQDQLRVHAAIQECINGKEKRKCYMLFQQFFNSQLFFIDEHFQNKEQVIQFMGQQLINLGITESGFIESVLKRENLSSTAFYETFAVPHAIELDAKQTMCCVLISKKGIQWDVQHIHIVLMIAVQQKDRKKFIELYEGIIKTMEDAEKVQRLLSVHDYYEFLAVLKDVM